MADSQPETMTTKDKMEELLLDGPPYLDEQKPYLTVNDLAEALEVTKATVRNNAPKVATHPLIDTDSVGQATVYYRAFEPSEEWGEAMSGDDADEFVESYLDDQQLKLVMQRALWLHERQRVLDIAPDDMDADVRFEAWERLMDYFRHMTLAGRVSFPSALEKASLPERYDTVDLSDYTSNGQPLPDGFGHLEAVLYDTPLFDAPDGDELRGVVALWAHHQWLRQEIDDDTPSSRLDELAPTAKDILYAGTVLDRLAVQLYGFDW